MPDRSAFSRLFSPVRLGPRQARNRIMQLALTNGLADGNRISERSIAFYVERARGGVGSIVTESMSVHPTGRGRLAAYDPDGIPAFRQLARAVQAHGTLLIGQLNHSGRQHHQSSLPLLWGPSAIACPYSGGTPHEMDLDEIQMIVEAFARSASNLEAAGFDGVEIHGAQGHLIQEFLSPFSNRRTDKYGGSLEGRARFALEVLRAVKSACSASFAIGFRLGAEEFVPDGLHFDEALAAARLLAATGWIDYFSVSQGNFASIEAHIPDRHHPPRTFLEYPARLKRAVEGVPVVAAGRILDPASAEAALEMEQADLIGLGRPLLSDPEWASKAANGQSDQIRRCISCNQCWEWIGHGQPIGCVQNAATGRELTWGAGSLSQADTPHPVVVVGGGPAGLEAARVAAERGHRVTLFERESRLGGALLLASRGPHHQEIGSVLEFLEPAVRRAGVELRLGEPATVERLLDLQPEAVVVATGATRNDHAPPVGPELPLLASRELFAQPLPAWRRVLVLDQDGYYEGLETAELLAAAGCQVHLATRFFEAGREVPAASRITTLRLLDSLGATVHPLTWLARSEGRTAVLVHVLSGRQWQLPELDAVVHVGGVRADDRLYRELKGRVPKLELIGDALMPRRLADAVLEGHRVGRSL